MKRHPSRRSTLWITGLGALAALFVGWAALGLRSLWTPAESAAVVAEWGRYCWRIAEETAQYAGLAGRTFSPMVGLFLAGSLLYGGIRGGASYIRTRRFLRSLPIRISGDPAAVLRPEISSLNDEIRLRVVEDPGIFAFTGGFLEPEVFLSRGMAEGFSSEELRSVLRHEAEHVSRRDPLRGWAADAVAAALWFLPVADDLRRRFLASSEEAADDRAAAGEDGPLSLASALVKTARGKAQGVYIAAPGFGGELSVTGRVERLVGVSRSKATRAGFPLSFSVLARSAGVVTLLGVLSLGGFDLVGGEGPGSQALGPRQNWMMGPGAHSGPMPMGGPEWMERMQERMRLGPGWHRQMQNKMEGMWKRGGPPHERWANPAAESDAGPTR